MPEREEFSATRTTTKLLDALRDHGNEPVWSHINARYRPVVKGLARRLGVGESDCEDVAQQTLAEFVRAFREGRYERSKGRLSSWILGIAHHISTHALRRSRRESSGGVCEPYGGAEAGVSDRAEAAPCDELGLRNVWDEERDRVILHQALSTLQSESAFDERTLMVFELVALRGVPVTEAASQCGMTVDQAYVARSRVTRKLRVMVRDLTQAFEEDA